MSPAGSRNPSPTWRGAAGLRPPGCRAARRGGSGRAGTAGAPRRCGRTRRGSRSPRPPTIPEGRRRARTPRRGSGRSRSAAAGAAGVRRRSSVARSPAWRSPVSPTSIRPAVVAGGRGRLELGQRAVDDLAGLRAGDSLRSARRATISARRLGGGEPQRPGQVVGVGHPDHAVALGVLQRVEVDVDQVVGVAARAARTSAAPEVARAAAPGAAPGRGRPPRGAPRRGSGGRAPGSAAGPPAPWRRWRTASWRGSSGRLHRGPQPLDDLVAQPTRGPRRRHRRAVARAPRRPGRRGGARAGPSRLCRRGRPRRARPGRALRRSPWPGALAHQDVCGLGQRRRGEPPGDLADVGAGRDVVGARRRRPDAASPSTRESRKTRSSPRSVS